MSDDIVTRLRGKEHGGKDLRCEACDGFCCHCELCDCCIEIMEVSLEAADEIQRLRKLISELAEIMMPYALLMTKAEQEQVLKAVRGGL